MKKHIAIVLITCIILSMLLGGCSLQQYSTEEQVEDTTKELEVWMCYDRNTPGAYYVFQMDSIAEEYGCTVNTKTYTKSEIENKLRMGLVCNELPDIFYTPGGTNDEYLFKAGACFPVDTYLEGNNFKEKYTIPYDNGRNYVIPCFPESYVVVYYDTMLLEKMNLSIPHTWEELIDLICSVEQYNLMNNTEYSAIELGEKDDWMGNILLDSIACSLNPERYEQDYEERKWTDDTTLAAAECVQQLINLNAFPENYIEIGEQEAVKNFINHKSVMMVHQSSLVYHLMQNMGPKGVQMELFPDCNQEQQEDDISVLSLNYSYTPGLSISTHSQYKDEAVKIAIEFAKQVNQNNVQNHGYLNIENTEYELLDDITDNNQFLLDLEKNATCILPIRSILWPQETEDRITNVIKKFYASELKSDELAESIKQVLEQE